MAAKALMDMHGCWCMVLCSDDERLRAAMLYVCLTVCHLCCCHMHMSYAHVPVPHSTEPLEWYLSTASGRLHLVVVAVHVAARALQGRFWTYKVHICCCAPAPLCAATPPTPNTHQHPTHADA